MDTRTAQLEVWAAREGGRRRGRRESGRRERGGSFIAWGGGWEDGRRGWARIEGLGDDDNTPKQ